MVRGISLYDLELLYKQHCHCIELKRMDSNGIFKNKAIFKSFIPSRYAASSVVLILVWLLQAVCLFAFYITTNLLHESDGYF